MNPYESPGVESRHNFQESAPSVSQLEHRIAELEKKLTQSWFLSKNLLVRTFAVVGHFLIGYFCIACIVAPIVMLMDWLFGP